MIMNNKCQTCYHYNCEYHNNLSTFDNSADAFELYCVGCPCGDGDTCNQDYGCSNYETEPIMG